MTTQTLTGTTYRIEVLENNNQLMEEVAQIISDVFVGSYVGTRYISEPMISKGGFTNKSFKDFTYGYLQNIVDQGLTVIAIDNDTNKVIGAIIAEAFDAYEEIPTFEGDLAPTNKLYEFLVELDHPFVERFEHDFNKKMEKTDLVHLFLLGIKAERKKAKIAKEIEEKVIEVATAKGYKGIFAEATNPKSQKVLSEVGYSTPLDLSGNPVIKQYAGFAPYDTIPADVSTECQIVYKSLDSIHVL